MSHFSCYYSSVHNTVSSANIRQTYNSVSSTGYNYSKKRGKKNENRVVKVVSFEPDVFSGCVPVLTERPDKHYCIENGMVTDNVGLNFSEPDSIICQNHVYDLSILFLREYGPPY